MLTSASWIERGIKCLTNIWPTNAEWCILQTKEKIYIHDNETCSYMYILIILTTFLEIPKELPYEKFPRIYQNRKWGISFSTSCVRMLEYEYLGFVSTKIVTEAVSNRELTAVMQRSQWDRSREKGGTFELSHLVTITPNSLGFSSLSSFTTGTLTFSFPFDISSAIILSRPAGNKFTVNETLNCQKQSGVHRHWE